MTKECTKDNRERALPFGGSAGFGGSSITGKRFCFSVLPASLLSLADTGTQKCKRREMSRKSGLNFLRTAQ